MSSEIFVAQGETMGLKVHCNLRATHKRKSVRFDIWRAMQK